MGTITTYTGHKFDPINPDKEVLDIRDIAHALSLTCRGNGHVKQFYSVGQHCIMCAKEAAARGYSKRVVLACLLHDASEAYMSDVPRPFKEMLPEYVDLEEKLIDLVYTKFLGGPLTEEEKKLVSKVDDDVLYFDMLELFGVVWGDYIPVLEIEPIYTIPVFEEVEKEYLELFKKWYEN